MSYRTFRHLVGRKLVSRSIDQMASSEDEILNSLMSDFPGREPHRSELLGIIAEIQAGRRDSYEMSYDAHWIELTPTNARIGHHWVDEDCEYSIALAKLKEKIASLDG